MRFLTLPILLGSLTMAVPGSGKHPSNAGPENFEIKFKLPPPPVLSPEQALKTFQIEDGFEMQLVAAEPLIQDPVALSFDEFGRIFVVEMRGYMHDVDGAGEDQPLGRVQVLQDTNGDGVMDKGTVFVDQLIMPRAVMAIAGGALIAEPPNLTLYQDTDADGRADAQKIIATDFGQRNGQPEHMPNTPMWALDNWIYSGGYANRFRFGRDQWISERTRSRGQWGMSQDDYGRLFYNTNSDFLRADMASDTYYNRNPYSTSATGRNLQVLQEQTVWPSHPTPGVNRGYEKAALRADGTLAASTSTCGPVIYRGDLFPAEFRGNAFLPEPAANLVKRVVLSEAEGIVTAKNAAGGREFLTSHDERFRPVSAYNAPDGALYLVDMYRGVIQHKGFLTNYLIANIKQRQLEQPVGMGRIWRIVPKGASPKATRLPVETPALVPLLAHTNGWVRDTAQRVLVERGGEAVVPSLKTMASSHQSALGRLHALWTLEGLGALDQATALAKLADEDSKVRAAAIRLCEPFLALATRADVLPHLLTLAPDPSADVRLQLAFTVASMPEAEETLAVLLKQNVQSAILRDAVISGLRNRELEFLERLLKEPAWSQETPSHRDVLAALAQCVMKERRSTRVQRLLEVAADYEAHPGIQLAILEGMSGKAPGTTAKAKAKPIKLPGEPSQMASLRKSGRNLATLEALDSRLVWPGKPGVPAEAPVAALTDVEQALFKKGQTVYATYCAACHQPTGIGQEGLAPPLVDSEWVLGPPERIVGILLHGLSGPITVNGAKFQLDMPPLPGLTDEEIAAVTTYVRREWEHTASPLPTEIVARIREVTRDRSAAWTGPELEKFRLDPPQPRKTPAAVSGQPSPNAS